MKVNFHLSDRCNHLHCQLAKMVVFIHNCLNQIIFPNLLRLNLFENHHLEQNPLTENILQSDMQHKYSQIIRNASNTKKRYFSN